MLTVYLILCFIIRTIVIKCHEDPILNCDPDGVIENMRQGTWGMIWRSIMLVGCWIACEGRDRYMYFSSSSSNRDNVGSMLVLYIGLVILMYFLKETVYHNERVRAFRHREETGEAIELNVKSALIWNTLFYAVVFFTPFGPWGANFFGR